MWIKYSLAPTNALNIILKHNNGSTSTGGFYCPQDVQGNCSDPPAANFTAGLTGPPLLPLRNNQCMLINDAPIMYVQHGPMLLENVYMRRQKSPWYATSLVHVGEGREWNSKQTSVKLWMVNVTMQVPLQHIPLFASMSMAVGMLLMNFMRQW